MSSPVQPTELVRQCRFCLCTPENPCKVPGGDECCYLGKKADRCSAPGYIVAFDAEYDRMIERERQHVRLIRKLAKGKKKHGQRRLA